MAMHGSTARGTEKNSVRYGLNTDAAAVNNNQTLRTSASMGEECYLAFLAILCGLKALGFYEGQIIFTLGMAAAMLFYILKIGMTRHTVLEYAVILVLMGIGILVYRNTGEKSLLINLAVVTGLKDVPIKRAFRTFFAVWGSCYVLLTFLSMTGLHGDVLYMHNKHGIGYVICHSMGYAHSNVLHINYLCISAMILYLVKDSFTRRQKAVLTAILAALNLYVFLYSVSFTGLIASFLFYCVYLFLILRGKVDRMVGGMAMALVPVLALFFVAGPIVIQGKLFDLINKALNTRFNLTRWFLQEQPITAFGTRFELPNYRYTLDCSYAYLFMQLGVVPFVILILLYVLTIRRLARDNRLTELAIMIGLCIAGGTEPFLFNMSFKNVTFLFIGEYLFSLIGGVQESRRNAAEYALPAKWENVRAPIVSGICDAVCHSLAEIYRSWQRNAACFVGIFLLCGGIGVGAAAFLRSPVHTVYISSSVNEEADRPSCRIDEYELQELEQGDALVYGYVDEKEEMYPYTGSAAFIEYVRILVSSGLWCGVIGGMLASAAQQYRRHAED